MPGHAKPAGLAAATETAVVQHPTISGGVMQLASRETNANKTIIINIGKFTFTDAIDGRRAVVSGRAATVFEKADGF